MIATTHRSRCVWIALAVVLPLAALAQPSTAAAKSKPPLPCKFKGDKKYPGDDAAKVELARWMGAGALKERIPAELPVMAALVESNLTNLGYGDADSAGFFQMR